MTFSPLERFQHTIAAFDAINAQDPTHITVGLSSIPKALAYAQRLSDMLTRYAPNASETLQLAARCQHIQRWAIPRSDYPMTKLGYHQWRNTLKQHHAEIAQTVMIAQAYDANTIAQVCSLLKKEQLRSNPEMQILEDVIVLAFLEHDLDEFVQTHTDYTEEKLIDILRKSYLKMSDDGKKAALSLIKLPTHLLPTITKAIS